MNTTYFYNATFVKGKKEDSLKKLKNLLFSFGKLRTNKTFFILTLMPLTCFN